MCPYRVSAVSRKRELSAKRRNQRLLARTFGFFTVPDKVTTKKATLWGGVVVSLNPPKSNLFSKPLDIKTA